MKLEIERFEQTKVDIFYNGEYYGTFNNEHECNLFIIKMVQNKCTHLYHLQWNNIKIIFDENGNMSKFPSGMYDTLNKHLGILFRLNKNNV